MKLCLTLDDAPMITPVTSRLPDAMPDPEAMDTIRVGLGKLGIRHCVAFVISAVAEADPGPLQRWLAAGYELGNHTDDHVPAHEAGVTRFVASIDRCDAALQRLGAFADGRTKWFRFPLLDYGADAAARRQLRVALRERGYRLGHASTDLYDHAYETALGRALRGGVPLLDSLVLRRFRTSAAFSVWQSQRVLAREFGDDVPQVLYAHFGRVSSSGMLPVLQRLTHRGATWCSLDEAAEHPLYCRMDDDDSDTTGRATGGLARGFVWRASRKLAGLAKPLARPWERRFGPTLPAYFGD